MAVFMKSKNFGWVQIRVTGNGGTFKRDVHLHQRMTPTLHP